MDTFKNNQMESSLLLFSPYPRCPERLTTPSSSPAPVPPSPPSATTGRGTLSVYFGRAGRGTSRSRGSELSSTSVPAPASNNYRRRSRIGWRTCLTAVKTPGSPSAYCGAGWLTEPSRCSAAYLQSTQYGYWQSSPTSCLPPPPV